MIPKAELREKLAIAEAKLSQIHKYIPSLEYVAENVNILRSMGYVDSEIHEVISSGSVYRREFVVNPQTGEKVAIHLGLTTIEKNPVSGKYEPYINNQPYIEFIESGILKTEKFDRLLADHPEVRELLKENERLKEALSHLTNK